MSKPSADYQAQLAAAIRQGGGLDDKRLAVYIRLIRNNINGFIDRCYTEAPEYFSDGLWAELKEEFIRTGRAHSPYFQDIAGEFLQFCRTRGGISDGILNLMDFEYTQLLAETAQTADPAPYGVQTPYTLSPAAFLRRYPHDVTGSLEEQDTALIIWRDPEDDVVFQEADEFDMLLLKTVSETPLSLQTLQEMLAGQMGDDTRWQAETAHRWQHWHKNGILTEHTNEF